MVYPDTFEGFQVDSSETWTTFTKRETQQKLIRRQIKPKPFGDYDVDVKILACGVCGSDAVGGQNTSLSASAMKSWEKRPKVTLIKTGERVGVGAQIYSCLDCKQCKNDNETYCRHQIDTYGAIWPDTGIVSQGGYASHIRAHEHWVFPIPDALNTTEVAPMLCAGLTAFSALVRNGAGPGKKIGIVGLGGIGHFGVLFAKALGAETWVISRSHAKEADSLKLGADGFIATADKDWNEPHRMAFDLIINTANSSDGFDLQKYLSLLDVHGRWISVGLPEGAGQEIKSNMFMENGCLIGASHLGSRKEVLIMLQLAVDRGIHPWVEEVDISEQGCAEAVMRLHKNDVKYRFTLTNFDKAFTT
ncbi:NADP-dependent alcohol dehydrogenase [Lachnellula occidentalis]|uniref:alcohol dehydrogenase (NADP(+)) n=1 Tax=Lachnellula occidentalis TaxID=215460 RepID=A0A8H8S4P6_9HELO|nr:NADP-dependent alcohol dehydrogenase [Lachnellula occidentalis]